MKSGIIVVGSINLDMVVRSPRIPGPGENVCGAGFQMVPGGKGANQAVAARKLGNDAHLLACAGKDFFGDFLLDRLSGQGVDASLVRRTDSAATGVALIVVEEDTGTNTIVVDPGANMALSVSDLDSIDPLFEAAGSILFQLEIPIEVVTEGAKRARKRGLTTILDAGPPRGIGRETLLDFDVVSPNRKELAAITGEPVEETGEALRAASSLVEEGIPTVVVKMGSEGALLVTGEEAVHLAPYGVEAVDTTAAGDAFTAGLATAIGDGLDPREAVRFANAAGAVAVTVLGAQPSMPPRDRVEELMGSQKAEERVL